MLADTHGEFTKVRVLTCLAYIVLQKSLKALVFIHIEVIQFQIGQRFLFMVTKSFKGL